MKKLYSVAFLLSLFYYCNAQQNGTNAISVALEGGIPTGDFGKAVKVGIGGALKLLFGVSESGQITATSGYSSFTLKSLPSDVHAHYSIVPIMAGYRHNFSGLYLEPQLGVGVYGIRASSGGQSDSDSQAGFTWAAGFGYAGTGVDIGIRYQSGMIKDSDSPFSVVGIHFGYVFPLR